MAVRYKAAQNDAKTRGVESLVQQFEETVVQQSQAIICRSLEEVTRLANNEQESYAAYYNLVRAGIRVPNDNVWDNYRERVDAAMFPYYKEHIRFAALSLNEKGLISFGECSLVLRNDMIAHRATVFEENSIVFAERHKIELRGALPTGYRALWEDRGKLAVAKLAGSMDSSISSSDFPHVLLKNGATTGDDEFIEVHIYGSISVRTLAKVSIRCSKKQQRSLRFRVLQEKLNNLNVACSVN